MDFKILFLDAADKELVARYKETRRSASAADGRILDGIKLERELLAPLKNMRSKCGGYDRTHSA